MKNWVIGALAVALVVLAVSAVRASRRREASRLLRTERGGRRGRDKGGTASEAAIALLSIRIKEGVAAYEPKAVSHALYVRAAERRLPEERREALCRQYGETMVRPHLTVPGALSDEEFGRLEEAVRQYMEARGFPWAAGRVPLGQLEEALYDEACVRADKILDAQT